MPEVTNNSADQFGKFGQIRPPNWGGGLWCIAPQHPPQLCTRPVGQIIELGHQGRSYICRTPDISGVIVREPQERTKLADLIRALPLRKHYQLTGAGAPGAIFEHTRRAEGAWTMAGTALQMVDLRGSFFFVSSQRAHKCHCAPKATSPTPAFSHVQLPTNTNEHRETAVFRITA